MHCSCIIGEQHTQRTKPVDEFIKRGLACEIFRCSRKASQNLGRESLVAGSGGEMGPLSEAIFRLLVRNALPATAYFRLPPEQVVEIGLQIDL